MKDRKMWLIVALFAVGLFMLYGCGGTAEQPAEEAVQEQAAEQPAEEPTEAPAEEPVERTREITRPMFQVSIVQYGAPSTTGIQDRGLPSDIPTFDTELSTDILKETIQRVTAEMGYPDTMIDVRILSAFPCGSAAAFEAGMYDIFMIESATAQHAFDQTAFAQVPEEPSEPLRVQVDSLFPGARMAYDNQGLVGVAQGIMPLMIIYNPEKVDIGSMTIFEILDFTNEEKLVVPPHGGIGVAAYHEIIGPSFTPQQLLSNEYLDQMGAFIDQAQPAIDEGRISSAPTGEIVDQFMSGTLDWTIHDSTFLRALAASGYKGPVAVAPLNTVEDLGGSSFSVAWTVPAESEDPKLAWEVIGRLVNDPDVIYWTLSNGFLPASYAGFERIFENPSNFEGLLPAALLADGGQLELLQRSAETTMPWRLPLNFNLQNYQENLQFANAMVGEIANGSITLGDAIQEFRELAFP